MQDKRKYSEVALMDLKSTFNAVNQGLLISKLHGYQFTMYFFGWLEPIRQIVVKRKKSMLPSIARKSTFSCFSSFMCRTTSILHAY